MVSQFTGNMTVGSIFCKTNDEKYIKSKLSIITILGESTGGFSSQRVINAETVSFNDIIMVAVTFLVAFCYSEIHQSQNHMADIFTIHSNAEIMLMCLGFVDKVYH